MKKSKYITKYDYINYFVCQPSMWFFTTDEIKSAYQNELEKYTCNNHLNNDFDDEEETDYQDESQNDDYEHYRELLEMNQNIDENNPQIQSGLIIDQESKKYIINEFCSKNYDNDFLIYDFDKNHEDLMVSYQKTLNLINQNKKIILFQPVFYDQKRNILTKCDALIKYENDITLVETKATSSAKFHHFLDLLFQKEVIEANLDVLHFNLSYKLCLIKYEKLNKNQVSFIISDTINLTKSVNVPDKLVDLSEKQAFKLGDKYKVMCSKSFEWIEKQNGYYLDDLFNLNSKIFEQNNDVNKQPSKNENKLAIIRELINKFDINIKELLDHKNRLEGQIKETPYIIPGPFIVHRNDHSIFKDTDLWKELRYLYACKGYEMFKYSGKIINFSCDNLDLIRKYIESKIDNIDLTEFLKGTNETQLKYQQLYLKNEKNILLDEKEYIKLIENLKSKLVFFDFETINPAIRVVNNSLPFTQVITQNSVIIDNGLKQDLECNNLMCDPKMIDNNFFKEVVDSLYRGSDYSYVVYNKSFECSRLKEIKQFINDKDYSEKIDTIINNIFDLADFFKVTKDKYVIFCKELKGFYSIKKILPLVNKYANYIFDETKCIDYNTLEISNGAICQAKTLARFYNKITDQEWTQVVMNSKKYCENDVRAMVAILKFIQELFSDNTIINRID